ncbi:MAG: sigma-70 family RNA polymerase sigma factor [Chloroflexota bacterium]|jgi:RNA polymerase primary sigma factor|nr:sigma-70 family RNA polymerase sigma factor [Chloroflexota bacterium]
MTVNTKMNTKTNVEFVEKISDQAGVIADDTVSLYLNEMDRVPLLSREEEVTLAKQMEAGRIAREKMLDFEGSDEERKALQKTINEGRNARDHMIKANIRLVVNIAKKYRRYSSSFLDLIQAGNVGLIRAVDKFDYTMGNRFSTYATWWVRRSVLRHLNQKERTIRLPNYLSTRIRKIHRVRKELMTKLSRTPTNEEIGEKVDMSAEEVGKLLGYARRAISLDQPIGEDGEADLQSYIENKNAPNPFTEVRQNLLAEDVIDALDELTEREAKILTMRFGLNGSEKHTLKELGEVFGITRERIRQIQKAALRKLRHPNVRRKLRHYF